MNHEAMVALQEAARATDAATAPEKSEGYVAQFHPLLRSQGILVFAPCGCRLMLGSFGEGLQTPCPGQDCVFDNVEAMKAVSALRESVKAPLEIVPAPEPDLGGEA